MAHKHLNFTTCGGCLSLNLLYNNEVVVHKIYSRTRRLSCGLRLLTQSHFFSLRMEEVQFHDSPFFLFKSVGNHTFQSQNKLASKMSFTIFFFLFYLSKQYVTQSLHDIKTKKKQILYKLHRLITFYNNYSAITSCCRYENCDVLFQKVTAPENRRKCP